ncbi:hypothetical protein SCHPADRAFT_637328 [Schizopora paradoxa]|uniref:Fungal lipase-type domain-containing protein n=1 Tax=Schizopora paradoxa TaxID=27342 RepID=A0A0H2RS84_9AGAM|nr:hypothetical protein SCHPADRAFT_696324 [Schizopora paradoxa]KLO07696.1 hypothetical protein SCHPADRAFT_637328 [Schizopora paradoxa]
MHFIPVAVSYRVCCEPGRFRVVVLAGWWRTRRTAGQDRLVLVRNIKERLFFLPSSSAWTNALFTKMVRCPPSIPPTPGSLTPAVVSPNPSKSSSITNIKLFNELRALHADEFAYLQGRIKGTIDDWEKSWWRRCLDITLEYFKFVAETWFKCAWYMVFFPPTLADWFSMVVLSCATSVVMTILFFCCLVASMPSVTSSANWVAKALFDDVSIANIAYPRIFKDMKDEHLRAAREHLAKPPNRTQSPDSRQVRVFNLDAAKLLLQCAALMYERTTRQTRMAARSAAEHKVPTNGYNTIDDEHQRAGAHIQNVLGVKSADAVHATLHESNEEEDMIRRIAKEDLGLEYYPVSECNSLGSAFCALFWDPNDTFIIVSFKGTTPTDFSDWRTDFSFHRIHANHWVTGFGKVHGGFMNKIFPRQIKHSGPYNTIAKAIETVAASLMRNAKGDEKVNVWITGHSLGCALGSVAYARMVTEVSDLGPNVNVRDAYLFAAPVVCDVDSAGAFNNRMNHFSRERNYQKTMWRITNGLDAVACSLPDAGDYTEWSFTPWNLFTFSHLGCEVKLRPAPNKCVITGHHITPGAPVRIESAFKSSDIDQEVTPLRQTLKCLQNLPIIGRIVAHAPGFYWSSLLEVGAGECEWHEDN